MGGMDAFIYNEIHISNIERNINKKCMAGLEIRTRDPYITRKVLCHWAILVN